MRLFHHRRHVARFQLSWCLMLKGYIIAKEATGTPSDKWAKFDGALRRGAHCKALSKTPWIRTALLGKSLGHSVCRCLRARHGACPFSSTSLLVPSLCSPGFISYYLSLGAREDELIAEGKVENRECRASWVIGSAFRCRHVDFLRRHR